MDIKKNTNVGYRVGDILKSLDRRYRAWCFLIYPEEIPNDLDWFTNLNELHIPIAISPIHIMALEGKPGEKDHYHVILSFDGKKSYEQVWELLLENLSTDGKNRGFTRPEQVNCLASYYRYLCHLDEQDKVKYDPEEITLLGGFNPHKYIEEQSHIFIIQMLDCIEEKGFSEFTDFECYCRENYPDTWLRLLQHNFGFFNTKLRSKRFKETGK